MRAFGHSFFVPILQEGVLCFLIDIFMQTGPLQHVEDRPFLDGWIGDTLTTLLMGLFRGPIPVERSLFQPNKRTDTGCDWQDSPPGKCQAMVTWNLPKRWLITKGSLSISQSG